MIIDMPSVSDWAARKTQSKLNANTKNRPYAEVPVELLGLNGMGAYSYQTGNA